MRLPLLAFALVLSVSTNDASAQQQQQKPPLTAQQQAAIAHNRLMHPWPMTAGNFEVTVQKALKRLHALRPVGPITQGDINKGILLYRDCTSTIEADGVVTAAEFAHCNQVMQDYQQERGNEIMMSSTPEQWQQWSQQAKAANPR